MDPLDICLYGQSMFRLIGIQPKQLSKCGVRIDRVAVKIPREQTRIRLLFIRAAVTNILFVAATFGPQMPYPQNALSRS